MAKHVPVRMCAACRERFPKAELTRYVRSEDGVNMLIDDCGAMPGRGCYVCSAQQCKEKFAKRSARRSRASA